MGIGVRVAATMIRDRSKHLPRVESAGIASRGAAFTADTTRTAGEKTRAVGRASKRFGEAVWGPLVHASGVLWLEVTGLFFGIFALFFAQNVYRLRHAYEAGQQHGKFTIYLTLALIFLYFTFSSFHRARRKGRRAKP